MILANPKVIEYMKHNNLPLPNPPVISSAKAGWEKLQLAMYRQPACYMPEYSSPYHIICVNTGNPVTVERTIDGRSQTIDAVRVGDVGIYPAGVRQSCLSPQNIELIRLYLEPTLLTQAQAELCLDREVDLALQLTPSFDPLIYEMAVALKKSLEIDGTSSKLYAGTLANTLAVHLLFKYSTHKSSLPQASGGLSEKQLKQVIDYIHECLDRDVSLTDLANLVQLSSYHFTRLFKRAIGFAPHQYHIRCRIDRAKQLLLEKKLSLAEIAYAVGFASQGHLNYHFKRIVGMTPTAFLRCK